MFKWCTSSHFGAHGELIKLELLSLIRVLIVNNNIKNTPNTTPVSLVGQGQYVFLISIFRNFYQVYQTQVFVKHRLIFTMKE